MTKQIFIGMDKVTPTNLEFSIKVPETVTHIQRLDVNNGAISSLEEFLDKISPLNNNNKKIGSILI
jgi:uncharacterized protein YecE (DUF72 family)